MARNTTKSKASQPAPKQTANKSGAASRQAAKPAPRNTPVSKPNIAKPSKEELRLQVEKLERANALLRKKNKDLKRAGGDAAERVAELETMVARFEQRIAKETAKETKSASRAAEAAPDAPKPRRTAPKRRAAGRRDPGDAVPPGVAVEQPEPLSEADQAVLDRLNEEPALAPEGELNA